MSTSPAGADGRVLIVNADDFGFSPAVNAGVIKAHEHGIVTSASLMVRWPAAEAAASYCREHPRLGLGLHLDFSEWVWRDGEWACVYQVVATDDPEAVGQEAHRQLEEFRHLAGADPTHIDSHQHLHIKVQPPVAAAIAELADELGVPLRHRTAGIRYEGALYAQTEKGEHVAGAGGVEQLLEVISALQPGVTELACHPGEGDEIDSVYGVERQAELAILCDRRVREAIARSGIRLCSFADLTRPSVNS
jgi:chitin disaccharide deacetylase